MKSANPTLILASALDFLGPPDDEEEEKEGGEYVDHREDPVHESPRIEATEVIDGRDEGVPRDDEPDPQGEVHKVCDVVVILGDGPDGPGPRHILISAVRSRRCEEVPQFIAHWLSSSGAV